MSSKTGVHGVDVAAAVGGAVRADVGTLLTIADGVGGGVLDGISLAIGCWSQYLPPVLNKLEAPVPPQIIISLPVHTAVCAARASGALVVFVAIQLSVSELYLLPVFKKVGPLTSPPQIIISLPVHTAV